MDVQVAQMVWADGKKHSVTASGGVADKSERVSSNIVILQKDLNIVYHNLRLGFSNFYLFWGLYSCYSLKMSEV